MSYKKEEIDVTAEARNLVMSHTAIPTPKLSVMLRGKELRKLATLVGDEDLVRIVEWSDFTNECSSQSYYHRITIVKHE